MDVDDQLAEKVLSIPMFREALEYKDLEIEAKKAEFEAGKAKLEAGKAEIAVELEIKKAELEHNTQDSDVETRKL